jgi:uncharacterized protein YndB with AHSA1/START domain
MRNRRSLAALSCVVFAVLLTSFCGAVAAPARRRQPGEEADEEHAHREMKAGGRTATSSIGNDRVSPPVADRSGRDVPMDIDQNAPVIAHEQLLIAADVQTVWDVLSDLERWPRWNKAVSSMAVDGPVAPGTSFRWKAGPGMIKSRIAEVDAPSRIVWTGVTVGIKAVDAFSFEAADGGTLVRQSESWDGLLARLFRSRMERTLRSGLRDGLRSLKAEAERRAASVAA